LQLYSARRELRVEVRATRKDNSMIVKHLPDGTVAVGRGGSLTVLKDGEAVCLVPGNSEDATKCRARLAESLDKETDHVRAAKLAGYSFGEPSAEPVELEVAETDLLHADLRRDIDEGNAEEVLSYIELVDAGEATWPEDLDMAATKAACEEAIEE
jgi:hypothetical protein